MPERNSRWLVAFVVSLVANIILFTMVAFYLLIAGPEVEDQDVPIQVQFVQDTEGAAGVAGGGGAPQIQAPTPEKVKIPPPPSAEELKAVQNGTIPVEEYVKQEMNQTQAVPVDSTETTGQQNQGPVTQENSSVNVGVPNEAQSTHGSNEVGSGDGGSGETRKAIALSKYVPALSRRGISNPNPVVHTEIDAEGNVISASIVTGSGSASADEAILDEAYGWAFEPAMDNGRPIADSQNHVITIPFTD